MAIQWVKLANVATLLEAELLVESLRAAGINASARGHDIVGIFGPGFSGATARGVDVMVTSDGLDAAREVLADYNRPD